MSSLINKLLYDRELNLSSYHNFKYYEDRIVNSIYNSKNLFYKTELKSKNLTSVPVEFSADGSFLFSGGSHGYIELWNMNENITFSTKPQRYQSPGMKCVYSLALNNDLTNFYYSTLDNNFHVCDPSTGEIILNYDSENSINKLSSSPLNKNLVSFKGKQNMFEVFDTRESKPQTFFIPNSSTTLTQFHPVQENILLIGSDKLGLFTYDIRNKKPCFYYNIGYNICDRLSYFTYNKKGNRILATRNHFASVLYDSQQSYPIYEFENFGYFILCDINPCCFAGPNDEYVVAGSNNFNIFVWKIPEKKDISKNNKGNFCEKVKSAKLVLKGHRCITIDLSYNYQRSILASTSSNIKLWSPFEFPCNMKSKKSNLSSNVDHERILFAKYGNNSFYNFHYYYIFDDSNESISLRNLYDDVLLTFLKTSTEFQSFSFNFNYTFFDLNCKTDFPLTQFKQDETFFVIKNWILNMKNNCLISSELFEVMEKLDKELDKKPNSYLNMQHLSFLIEGKKFYQLWNFISYFILYLMRHSILIEKALKQNQITYEVQKNNEKEDQKNTLTKIKLIIDLMCFFFFKSYLNIRYYYLKLKKTMDLLLINSIFKKAVVFRQEIVDEVNKFVTMKDFKYENNDESKALFNKRIMNNSLFDEDLNTSLDELKKRFQKQLKFFKNFEIKNLKVENSLDKLLSLFCELNN